MTEWSQEHKPLSSLWILWPVPSTEMVVSPAFLGADYHLALPNVSSRGTCSARAGQPTTTGLARKPHDRRPAEIQRPWTADSGGKLQKRVFLIGRVVKHGSWHGIHASGMPGALRLQYLGPAPSQHSTTMVACSQKKRRYILVQHPAS